MLVFIIFSFLTLIHQSIGTTHLDRLDHLDHLFKLLKTHPTWSFEVVSAESMINNAVRSMKSSDSDLTKDILRDKFEANFGPRTTHIVRKVGDPKWPSIPPRFFDAREKWKQCAELMNEVEDEGNCFSDSPAVAASIAADRYCIFTNGTFKERLSQEMLASCAELCTRKPQIMNSHKYIAEYGIPTGGPFKSKQGCLPYENAPCKHTNETYYDDDEEDESIVGGNEGKLKLCNARPRYDNDCPTKCSNRKYSKSLDNDRIKYTTFYGIGVGVNEFVIRNEIFTYGPVGTSIILYDDFFNRTDSNGMYQKKDDSEMVVTDKYIKLIGWGEEEGKKYWLAVNTWDEWEGTSSKIFKILRGINHVSVEFIISAGVFGDIN